MTAGVLSPTRSKAWEDGGVGGCRGLYITILIVHNAIKGVWGRGWSPLMSSYEQWTHVNQDYEKWGVYATLYRLNFHSNQNLVDFYIFLITKFRMRTIQSTSPPFSIWFLSLSILRDSSNDSPVFTESSTNGSSVSTESNQWQAALEFNWIPCLNQSAVSIFASANHRAQASLHHTVTLHITTPPLPLS